MSEKKINPIRPTDDTARQLARQLIVDNRHATLAVLEPSSGFPLASRIATMVDPKGDVVFLASDLSFHSQALAADQRASILMGEPGKGDPLAHPRITLIGPISVLDRESSEHKALLDAWLNVHPKSALYIDFGDFRFYRMTVNRAHLNGGFGKAFVLDRSDIVASS